MSRDPEQQVARLAQFAGELYLLADARIPSYLAWQVRMYDDALHGTQTPVVELRVARGTQSRRFMWRADGPEIGAHESAWTQAIRDGLDRVLHGLAV